MFVSVMDPNVFWASQIHNYFYGSGSGSGSSSVHISIGSNLEPKYNKSLYLGRHFLVMPKNQVKMERKKISKLNEKKIYNC
jgi:hypothetical protein